MAKKQNSENPLDLDQFIDRLVVEKGIDKVEPEVLAQVKADLKDSLERRINATLVANLKPELLADFEKLLDQKETKKIQSFFQKNIPDLPEVLAAEFLSFRKTYLGI